MREFCVIGIALCLRLNAVAQTTADDLFQAIRNNDLTALKTPLAPGADVNGLDDHDTTLLMQAVAFGSPEAVKMLLERGADVNAKNAFDNTALTLGANDPEKTAILLDKGADVSARTKLGRTALMIAAACDGCSQTVRLLIAKGADVNAADPPPTDKAGNTPLQFAASHCNGDAVTLLLSKDAKVDAKNTDGGDVKFGKIQLINLTPLMWAAPYCNAGVIKP